MNAAQNIALNLSIERRPNLDQFYWLERELIVPVAKEDQINYSLPFTLDHGLL